MAPLTLTTSVDDLAPGDLYLWGEVGETIGSVREVLAVVARTPRGILFEVRKQDGDVTRSFLNGRVTLLRVDGAVA